MRNQMARVKHKRINQTSSSCKTYNRAQCLLIMESTFFRWKFFFYHSSTCPAARPARSRRSTCRWQRCTPTRVCPRSRSPRAPLTQQKITNNYSVGSCNSIILIMYNKMKKLSSKSKKTSKHEYYSSASRRSAWLGGAWVEAFAAAALHSTHSDEWQL